MAKIGLDAICAKLTRSAEGTTREPDNPSAPSSPRHSDNNNDDDSVPDKTAAMVLDEDLQTEAASSPLVAVESVAQQENVVDVDVGSPDVVLAGPGAVSLMDSGFSEEAVLDVGRLDGASTLDGGCYARRSRRKNFLPRCVHDRLVVDMKQTDLATSETTTTTPNGGDDSDGVLDLRVVSSPSAAADQPGEDASPPATAPAAADDGDTAVNGVLDLSVTRCVRHDNKQQCDVEDLAADRSSTCDLPTARDELTPADIRVYAADTMTELLHIYGLPDYGGLAQAAVSDLRKWTIQDNGTTGTSERSDVHQRPMELGTSGSIPQFHDRQATIATSCLASSFPSTSPRPAFDQSRMQGVLKRQRDDGLKLPMTSRDAVKQTMDNLPISDYNQYVSQHLSRNSSNRCCSSQYQGKDTKEHFHCTACVPQVCLKKEDVIRHFKWHKKRSDSLQHGFMRFSPHEDCSRKFYQASSPCIHNGQHTHYHCIQEGCSKVYISTSDVQMHANYHRKDSAIIQEGFQRYRATENCRTPSCVFMDQKTTHFHCRRSGCCFTFKNKSDMEKHKVYHQKDEALTRDGFKKFMKYEQCQFVGCPYSHLSNHIHCIRPGCNYVLHSSGQLFSHKRKHERRAWEYGGGVPCKQLKLSSTSASFSGAAAAAGVSSVPAAMEDALLSPVSVAWTVQDGSRTVDSNELAHNAVDRTVPCVSSPVRQCSPKNDSQPSLAYVSKPSITAQLPDRPVDVSARDRTSSSSNVPVAWLNDASKETLKPEAVVSVKLEPTQPEADTEDVDREVIDMSNARQSPVKPSSDNNNVLVKTGSPVQTSLPFEQSASPVAVKLEKLQKKEYVDLEELAKMTNLKQIVNEDGSGATSIAANVERCSGVLCTPPAPALTTRATAASAASSVLSLLSSKSFPAAKSSRAVNEKKERDESWKKYLKRYTANDVCVPRCQLMYKDHYHCIESNCCVLFRSKEGVRDHAKLHEQQDRVTSMTYCEYAADVHCPDDRCQYSARMMHYHCSWVDCNYVVSSSHPVFARLEHHRSHEYSSRRMPSAGGVGGCTSRKRRGRPPKCVVDYEFSEEEIRARAAADGSSPTMAHGFVRFTASDQCPDRFCAHRLREHFHCVRARCHDVEVEHAALVAHDRDFHANVRITVGFEFFGAEVDCRRSKCKARRGCAGPTGLRHFHCVRSGCDYAFVRQSTMAQHDAKHRLANERELLTATVRAQPLSSFTSTSRQPVPIVPRPGVSLLQSSACADVLHVQTQVTGGRSLQQQVAATPLARVLPPMILASPPTAPQSVVATPRAILVPSVPHATSAVTSSEAIRGLVPSTMPSLIVVAANPAESVLSPRSTQSRPLSALLTGAGPAAVLSTSSSVKTPFQAPVHHGARDSCGHPFCKLKRRDHFHCVLCSSAFSDSVRLREHLSRMHTITASVSAASVVPCAAPSDSVDADLSRNSSALLPPSTASSSTASVETSVHQRVGSCDDEFTVAKCDDDEFTVARCDDDDDDDDGELAIDLSSGH